MAEGWCGVRRTFKFQLRPTAPQAIWAVVRSYPGDASGVIGRIRPTGR